MSIRGSFRLPLRIINCIISLHETGFGFSKNPYLCGMEKQQIDWSRTDGLIFDMDGTLWDAVDTYARIWNEVFLRAGREVHVTRESLIGNIGIPIPRILDNLFPNIAPEEAARFSKELADEEPALLSRYGGTPYPGVVSGLERLSHKYKLFLVSNCDTHTLPIFMSCIGITPFITEAVSYGDTHKPKGDNMLLLKAKYGLQQPLYMGDIEADGQETHRAGLPFVYARYGFGHTDDYELAFDSFDDFTEFFLNCK